MNLVSLCQGIYSFYQVWKDIKEHRLGGQIDKRLDNIAQHLQKIHQMIPGLFVENSNKGNIQDSAPLIKSVRQLKLENLESLYNYHNSIQTELTNIKNEISQKEECQFVQTHIDTVINNKFANEVTEECTFLESITFDEKVTPNSAVEFTISDHQETRSKSTDARKFLKSSIAISACYHCGCPITQAHINDQKAILYKQRTWYCLRCICHKERVIESAFDIDKYRIVQRLGEGGMASVFLGVHKLMYRLVAIKILKEYDKKGAFEKEATIAASLFHPNVVQVFDAGVAGSQNDHYIIMEYIEGVDLHKQVEEEGPLSAKQVAWIGYQIADVLELAEQKNIVHRDLKPANLFQLSDGSIKLGDFGIAKILEEEGLYAQTATCSIKGTMFFMPPEQYSDPKNVDHRSDFYALGATLYYLLTKSYPLPKKERETFHSYGRRLLYELPVPLQDIVDIPRGLNNIIMKCLNKNQSERVQSAHEIKTLLENFL